MSTIGKIVTFFLVMTPLFMWQGYVIKLLWGWFLVPNLGAPPIGVVQAIGISVLYSLLSTPKLNDDDEDKPFGKYILEAIVWGTIIPAFFLGIGWIAHFFM